jgi:hypothetical protein
MFDGFLPLYEGKPEEHASPAPRPWPWELAALVLVLTSLTIVAALLFPGVLALPVDHF